LFFFLFLYDIVRHYVSALSFQKAPITVQV